MTFAVCIDFVRETEATKAVAKIITAEMRKAISPPINHLDLHLEMV